VDHRRPGAMVRAVELRIDVNWQFDVSAAKHEFARSA
jgi:hypothetical protein